MDKEKSQKANSDRDVRIMTNNDAKAPTAQTPGDGNEEEIGLLQILTVLAKYKEVILGIPFLAAVLTAGISVLMPNIYTATAKILPPQQSQSTAAAMLSQLGGLANLAGGSLGIKNPSDIYVAMLKSRTVADALIQRYGLRDVYDQTTFTDTRRELSRATNIAAGKDGVITVEVDDREPKRAAGLANAYVDELEKLSRNLAVTEAAQRRLFFEKQLKDTREQLAYAEAELQMRIDTKGLTGVEVRGRSQVEIGANLRGQITARQIQLDSVRVFATEDHPDVHRLRREIVGLKEELAKIEGGSARASETKVPPAGLESLRRLREVKYLEAVADLLTRQYEAAKIDEAKEAVLIQVLDVAVTPEKKSKPQRTFIVLLSALAAGTVALIWAFVREGFERDSAVPLRQAQQHVLMAHWKRPGVRTTVDALKRLFRRT